MRVLLACLVSLLCPCLVMMGQVTIKEEAQPNYLSRTYAKEELDKLLNINMTKDDLVKIFGEPYLTNDSLYIYQIDTNKVDPSLFKGASDFKLSGFTVSLMNGKVVAWSLNTFNIKTVSYLTSSKMPETKVAKIELKFAEAAPKKGFTALEVPGSKDKIYVGGTVVVSNKDIEELILRESYSKINLEFVLVEDATKRITELIKNSREKQFVLFANDKAIIAFPLDVNATTSSFL